jgi:hypothetical protein
MRCYKVARLVPIHLCSHTDGSSQYRGVVVDRRRPQKWRAQRWCKEVGRNISLGSYLSEEEAAHVSDLPDICLGHSTTRLNFPASEYEAGGRWEEEAREAAGVGIDELATIWKRRSRQRILDGVQSQPVDLATLLLGSAVARVHWHASVW